WRLHPAADPLGARAIQQDGFALIARLAEVEPDHLRAPQEGDRIPGQRPLRGIAVPREEPLARAIPIHHVHGPGGRVTGTDVVPLAPREEDALTVRGEPGKELDLGGVRELAESPGPQIEQVELVVAGAVRGPHDATVQPRREG